MREPAKITPDLIAQHGITPEKYQRILSILGREPNFTELGIFSVMWSEHCSYKSSRVHLRTLPTQGPCILQGPGENAGVVDIGDGLAIVFKMESHNHPSFIEPRQGAATGVGGIIRDIFTMGARPIALLDPLRFGPLTDAKSRFLAGGVVAGMIAALGLPETVVQEGIAQTQEKVARRVKQLRGNRRLPDLTRRTVILVDDGLASGFTMHTAVDALHRLAADKVIIAVPTGHAAAVARIAALVDSLYCPNIRQGMSFAVADAYEQWTDVSEATVAAIMQSFSDMYHTA